MPILGIEALEAALRKVGAEAEAAMRASVAQMAATVEARAKANFEGAHKKGQRHVGGDKPNVVTGTLRRSIRTEQITRTGPGNLSTRVGPTTVYARRVELGYDGSKGYPYFTPAVNASRPEFSTITGRQWRTFLHE